VLVLLYPNPARDVAKVLISTPALETVSYEIVSISGALIAKGNYALQPGSNSFDLPLNTVAPGQYTLVIKARDGESRVAFVRY
jgi:hypothetical protein